MNSVLISDPFLFPPSGEDSNPLREACCTHPDRVKKEDQKQEAFITYTKEQFDLVWEAIQSDLGGSTLFETPFQTNISQYIPDTPESLISEDDEMNAENFINTQSFSLLDDGMAFSSDESMTFSANNCTEDFGTGQQVELSCALGEGDFLALDSPKFNTIDDEALFDLYEILNEKPADKKPPTSSDSTPNESYSDQSLQESSVSLVSPPSVGATIPVVNHNEYTTIDSDVVVSITSIEPPPYDAVIKTENNATVAKRRTGRKASLTARQCSESPSYNFPIIKTEITSPGPMEVDVKPIIGTKRSRKDSTKGNQPSQLAAADKKKIKLYELDDPAAKNAKAAYLNRQKKKEKMVALTTENQALSQVVETQQQKLEEMQKREEELKSQLEEHQRKTQAATGLNRILKSAKDVLETVMVPLHKKYGPWNLQVAPWFSQVETAMNLTGKIPQSLGGNEMTSKFITLHLNPEERVAMVDYRPDVPVLPDAMPQ